jgi:hypothetical protein
MAKTSEQIQAENELAIRLGETVIPTDDNTDTAAIEAKRVSDEAAAKLELDNAAETQRLADEAAKQTEGEEPLKITATKKVEEKVIDADDKNIALKPELTEEEVLKFLSKKSGKEVKSVAELFKTQEPTAEDKEKQAEEREGKKVAYGLENGIITKKQFESFIAATSDPKALVFKQYFQEQKESDETLTEERAQEEFDEKFGLNTEEDSRKHKRGLKEINVLAETIIRKEFKSVFELDEKFNQHENTISTTAQESQMLSEKTPFFTKDIQEVATQLKKLPVSVTVDGIVTEYSLDIDDDIIQKYVGIMATPENASKYIKENYTKERLENEIRAAITIENMNGIVSAIVQRDRIKNQAGIRGVFPNKDVQARKIYSTDEQKRIDEATKKIESYGNQPVCAN